MVANELRCTSCTMRRTDGTIAHVPFQFVPRALVQRESGRQAFVPLIRCPSCEHVEEWPGYDFMAVTSDAVLILAACRNAIVLEQGPGEVVMQLTRIIQRFNNQINHEIGRLTRARLGI